MKKVLVIVLSLAMIFSLAACGGGADTPAPTENPATGSEAEADGAPDNDMVVALQADATSMDPFLGSNGISNLILDEMYQPLINFNQNSELIPYLATEWSVGEDRVSYTFKLREGVKFHDGEPFNAEAVKAVYDFGMANQDLRIYRTVKDWESVTVNSEYEVVIKLVQPNNTFLNKLTQVRMVSPKAMAAGTDFFQTASGGTGPYVFSERADGDFTKMVPNTEYWGDGPKVDSLTFKVVPEDGSRLAMLKTGEADVIYPVPVVQVENLKSDSNIVVTNFPGTRYRYATLNKNYTLADGRKPFDDVRVRQAMNYAFDSKAYAQVVFNGFATEPTSVYASSMMYHHKMTPYSLDLEKAKALMKEAGYESGFDCNIWVDNTTIEMNGAQFFKQQMAEIGINVDVQPQESSVIAERCAEPEATTEVCIWYVNWSSGSYEADGSMRSILHGDKFPDNKGYNTAFYNNAEFNKLLDEALVLTDTAEIADKYAKAQEIVWEECPWVFLGVDDNLVACRNYVDGLLYKPGGTMQFTAVSLGK